MILIISVLIVAFVLVMMLTNIATRSHNRRDTADHSDYSPGVSHWFEEREKKLKDWTQAKRESDPARRKGRSYKE
jgi:hypothetical protein